MTTREQDIRVEILNTLLTTPHRALDQIWPVHLELIGKDPRFYVRLAAWYANNGDVRDHKEMFIVNLVLSNFPGHRDAGLAMLRGLPPYQVVRVMDFISGRKKTRKVRKGEEKKALSQASCVSDLPGSIVMTAFLSTKFTCTRSTPSTFCSDSFTCGAQLCGQLMPSMPKT